MVKIGSMVLDETKVKAIYHDGEVAFVFVGTVSLGDEEDDEDTEFIPIQEVPDNIQGFVRIEGEEGTWLINEDEIVGMDYDEEEGSVIVMLRGCSFIRGENLIVISREEDEEMFKRARRIYEEWMAKC